MIKIEITQIMLIGMLMFMLIGMLMLIGMIMFMLIGMLISTDV